MTTPSGQAPLIKHLDNEVPAAAAATAQDNVVGRSPFSGAVTGVTFTPEAAITGAATNFRTYRLVNRGQNGSGTTVVASLAFDGAGVTAAVHDERTIPLTANTTVAEGDILVFDEVVAGTGLASPGGFVTVTVSRT